MTPRRKSVLASVLLALFLSASSTALVAAQEKLLNLNTATATELTGLKGIGDAKAKAIVEYREKNGPFKSVDDLTQVRGIGDKLLAQLRPQVTVGAAPAHAAAAPAKP